jgi:hypothetical protein
MDGERTLAPFMMRHHLRMGCRRVEYDRRSVRSWRKCSRVFAWMSPSAKKWRQRVGEVTAALHVKNYDGLNQRLGGRWAHELRETITGTDDEEWREFISDLRMVGFRRWMRGRRGLG